MRQPSAIPLTIAISALVHVGLFGAAHWLPDPPRIPADTPITIELVPPTPLSEVAIAPTKQDDPIEVVFIDPNAIDPNHTIDQERITREPDEAPIDQDLISREPIARTASPPRAPAAAVVSPDAVAITTPGSSNSELGSSKPSPDTRPDGRNPYLDMRRAPSPRIAVRGWDDLENVPKGTEPEKDISTGKLAPNSGSTHKSDQGAFVAKVNKDGSVKLRDKRNFNIHLTLPSAKDIGDMFQAWYYDPNKPVGTLGPPNVPKRRANLTREDVSGAERLDNDDSSVNGEVRGPTSPSDSGGLPIAAGGFDITDAFMRGRGVDPYASKKLAFLDSTRDERVQIGARYKSAQLAQVAQIVKKNLARIWAATNDPQQRKQALFEMWDECVESGSEEVVVAANTARKIIIGFARANFPAGSDHAFTEAEIAACNRAKQSHATFSPYTD